MLTFQSFTGINNVVPPHRLGEGDLTAAVNVDIGMTGEISRRAGFIQKSDLCHKNLHQAAGFMLATVGSRLTAIHPDGARHEIHPSLGSERVWYCNLPDGRTTYTNGFVQGVTDGLTNLDRSVPTPDSLGVLDMDHGALTAGAYRYALSYIRLTDQLEGPAVASEPVQLDQGGLRLSGLPQRDGFAINIYISGLNGEGQYLAGLTSTRTFEFNDANSRLVLPCRTLGAQGFPVGTVTAYWRGRVLVATDGLLCASRPFAPHLADWRDFKQMGAPITAIQPVKDGVYVGTSKDLIFLSGSTWEQLTFSPTKRGPVVRGSGVDVPGHQIKVGDGVGNGEAMLCIAGGEIVAGFEGGQTVSLTANRYKTDATQVCAAFRKINGIHQYVAVPQ